MKKKLLRIFSIILICCISFLCVGCMGSDPDEFDEEFDEDQYQDEMFYPMYGTRVLYRPDSYNYNTGSGAVIGQTNDYYGKYAYLILKDLYQSYGITISETLENSAGISVDEDKLPYFYDSIRYSVDSIGTVTHTKNEGEETATELNAADQYIVIGAELNPWKWSFDYDLSAVNSGRYNSILFNSNYIENTSQITNHYYSKFDGKEKFIENINSLYTDFSYTNFYSSAILGTSNETDSEHYSDFVKTLEYVVYSYALDLEPNQVTVNINDNATSVDGLYDVSIAGFTSVDDALADVKDLFNKIGSYVGLIERQINKISAWIKSNVIGDDVVDYFTNPSDNSNDSFTTYQSVTEVKHADGSVTYEFGVANASTLYNLRNYDKTNDGSAGAVDNIVKAVCSNVSIGTDNSGGNAASVTINNRFLASEVKEYAGETFFIFDDVNFPAPGTSTASTAIQPLEYQSVQIMPKESMDISDVWIALKYDADLDGTIEGVYDPTKYLDIIVELNFYHHTTNKLYTVGSQKTRVYDGAYQFSEDYTVNGETIENHGMVLFSDFATNCQDKSFESIAVNGEGIHLEPFNPDIGGGILKTDVGDRNYIGWPVVSTNPKVLVGTNDARKFYSIIEPLDEELEEGTTYITGRSNEKMYSGSDGCDYFEITYKVLKKKGDRNTNYKFYTGIAAIFDAV